MLPEVSHEHKYYGYAEYLPRSRSRRIPAHGQPISDTGTRGRAGFGRKVHNDGDLDAARQLVLCHLRFVAHLARTYQGYGLPHADLIQEGNVGLMKAVKRFDPSVGVRLYFLCCALD